MNNSEQVFHTNRRAFVIMHDGLGLIVGKKNADLSHKQIFENLGLNPESVSHCLQKYPRGYFMDNELCIYQGYDMTPNAKWELAPQNYALVRQYMPKLRTIFNLQDNTNLYLGVIVGDIGAVWPKINKTTVVNFMRTK